MGSLHIGVAQLRPAWNNKAKTTEIVIGAMREAAERGIEVLAFSETFLSGYPFWVCRTNGAAYEDARQQRAYAQFLEAAAELDGPELRQIAEAARDLRICVYLGVNERGARAGRGTVWCTLVTISATAGILGAHRKLMPTYDERLCWGIGDAHGLRCHELGGFRIGGLNCWENWMPLARNALYEDGEEIHFSVWPGNAGVTHDLPKLIAHEGRVWSASACGLLSQRDIPEDFEFYPDFVAAGLDVIFSGGSMILAPDQSLVAQMAPGEAGIISAVVDAAALGRARQNFDVAGHYARPDIFEVAIRRARLGA